MAEHVERSLRYSGSWPSLGWTMTSDAWLTRTWERIVQRMAEASSWYADQQKVPAVIDGRLHVVATKVGGRGQRT